MSYDEVCLKVPKDCKYTMIFRGDRQEMFDLAPRDDFTMYYLKSPQEALPHIWLIFKYLGGPALFKTLLKLCTGKRHYYFAVKDGEIASVGWVNTFCKSFAINPGEIFIGPIETSAKFRNQGIASWSMRWAINKILEQGYNVYYGDADVENVPSHKVQEKCDMVCVGVYPKGMNTKRTQKTLTQIDKDLQNMDARANKKENG